MANQPLVGAIRELDRIKEALSPGVYIECATKLAAVQAEQNKAGALERLAYALSHQKFV